MEKSRNHGEDNRTFMGNAEPDSDKETTVFGLDSAKK